MNKFIEMFHYGKLEKRIIITIMEYIVSSIIWIVIDQYMTLSLFDDAINKSNLKLVIFLAIVMIVKIFFNIAEGILNCRLRHHLQRDFSNYARKDIFDKLINSKIQFFDKKHSGELFELEMNDTENLATFFSQNGNQLISFSIRALTNLVILLFVNLKLSLILIVMYIFIISLLYFSKLSFIFSLVILSILLKESSKIIIFLFNNNILAIEILCFCPPLKLIPLSPNISLYLLGNSWISLSISHILHTFSISSLLYFSRTSILFFTVSENIKGS